MNRWRLIEHGACLPAQNMAVDEAMAIACRRKQVPPTLRLYTWSAPTLSIGYFQDALREVRLAECRALGHGPVRRPTGGRAVLHDFELTYSVVSHANDPRFPRDLHGTFKVIAQAIILGLNRLGLAAQLFDEAPAGGGPGRSRLRGACFAEARGFEIGVGGKKLVGSAQRRWKDGFLQHGSILCRHEPERLMGLLNFEDDQQGKLACARLGECVTSLSALLLRRPDLAVLRQVLCDAFEETLKIRLMRSDLTPFERDLSRTLAAEKYATDAWNLNRQSPRGGPATNTGFAARSKAVSKTDPEIIRKDLHRNPGRQDWP